MYTAAEISITPMLNAVAFPEPGSVVRRCEKTHIQGLDSVHTFGRGQSPVGIMLIGILRRFLV